MIANPRAGRAVRIHYRKSAAHAMPDHGKRGKVVIVGRGKPRNHGVEIDGKIVVVPCGNLIGL